MESGRAGGGEVMLSSNAMSSAGGETDLVEDKITFIILASLKASFFYFKLCCKFYTKTTSFLRH